MKPAAAAAAATTQSLFVYGTLMAPAVTQTLLRRLPAHAPAILTGFARHPVRSEVFPGLVHGTAPADSVTGMLYKELTVREFQVLDWYEDLASGDYDRIAVVTAAGVSLRDDPEQQQQLPAQVYVWNTPNEQAMHMDRDWCFARFERDSLQEFLEQTVRPCRNELDQLGL